MSRFAKILSSKYHNKVIIIQLIVDGVIQMASHGTEKLKDIEIAEIYSGEMFKLYAQSRIY